jgi:hypothetical protein
MKYAIEMASDGIVYLYTPSIMKIGLGIQALTSTVWEAAMLVLLIGRIYDVCHLDDLRWYNMYIPSFMTIGSGIAVILKVLPQ